MSVEYELDGSGIVTITLDSQKTRNAITEPETMSGLLDRLARAEADPAARVIILTARGKSFSSGGNVKAMGRHFGINDPSHVKTRQKYRDGIQAVPRVIERMELPIIAAVNGHAIGAGCDLALMCDIRIAGESASFAESFVRIGIVPGDGGAWLLPRVVGFAVAAEMALTGEMIDAKAAKEYGLVSRVVPDEALLPTAKEIALKIAAHPAHAIRMTRRLLREACNLTLEQTLELSAAYQALCHSTDDHVEAVDSFLEKRAPTYRGS